MTDEREKLSTGPGLPDEALAPGEELPPPPSDEEIERAAVALKAPIKTPVSAERDTLPLEGE